MDHAEIVATLKDAMGVEMKLLDPEEHPRERVDHLQNYIGVTAIQRARLERALYWCIEAAKVLRKQWDALEGWEVNLPRGSQRTKEQVTEAKRHLSPQVYEGIRDAEELKSHLHRQIRRLELDYEACSREYTIISGK